MKKLSVILFSLLIINFVSAQTLPLAQSSPTINSETSNGKKVPFVVLNQFKTDYPNQQPAWSMNDDYYRASFIDGKNKNGHAAAYDKQGNVIYREEQLAKGDYPTGIANYYTSNFPNDKYEIWSNTNKTGLRCFYTKHNNEILWFDEKGNYRNKSKNK